MGNKGSKTKEKTEEDPTYYGFDPDQTIPNEVIQLFDALGKEISLSEKDYEPPKVILSSFFQILTKISIIFAHFLINFDRWRYFFGIIHMHQMHHSYGPKDIQI